MKDLVWIYSIRQRLKRAAPDLDPYVGAERYFEYSVLLRSLRQLPSRASILDVGSGNSLLPTLLAARGFILTCVDPYEIVRRQRVCAQVLSNSHPINVVPAKGESLPFWIVLLMSPRAFLLSNIYPVTVTQLLYANSGECLNPKG